MSGRIAYPDNPFMALAWRDCLLWAAGEPGIVAAYEEDRGRPFILAARPRTPLDLLIDEATGAPAASALDFIEWFNAAVWGEDPFSSSPPVYSTAEPPC